MPLGMCRASALVALSNIVESFYGGYDGDGEEGQVGVGEPAVVGEGTFPSDSRNNYNNPPHVPSQYIHAQQQAPISSSSTATSTSATSTTHTMMHGRRNKPSVPVNMLGPCLDAIARYLTPLC